ncbi:MAG: putative rRNA maturation factor [Alphaproteobacteria bacterium]|jgi:probable rRNA maturation factor|nr:putative rRNA maturation factor [Alphaproteobacteria bacterium]MEA3022635.1 putative rRNA maturation factor [Alphaproteobacteria bacterium]
MRPSRRQDARGPAVDVVIASTRWSKAPQAAKLVRRTIAAAAPARAKKAELSVILTSNRAIGALNRQWRGQDKPTNVLSFPAPKQATKRAAARGAPRHLGDIVIAYETAAAEARAERKPFDHHLAHLAVHGFLHLLGYDHESDSEADAMERRERMILSRLGVPDPYAARDADD